MVGEASIAYGGVAPLTIMAPKTMAALQGRPLDAESLKAGLAAVEQDVQMAPNAPGTGLSQDLSFLGCRFEDVGAGGFGV